jgi:hypothetical protein
MFGGGVAGEAEAERNMWTLRMDWGEKHGGLVGFLLL